MKWTTRLKDFLWSLKSNRKAQITVLVIILIVAVGIAGFFVFRDSGDVSNENGNTNVEEGVVTIDGKVRRFIDGELVEPEDQNPYPIAIMVENLVTVRPQSGLSGANIVYEALAEGGITRFMAVYLDGSPVGEIGPVRSARHYYLDWANEFHGMYAHIGGSPQALGAVGNYDIYNLEAMVEGTYFNRKDGIPAPHDLFTAGELMGFAVRDHIGDDAAGDFDPWLFKDDRELEDRGDQKEPIEINFSSFSYDVSWEYDKEENHYLRSNGSEPATDANTGDQLTAKNVIVQFADTTLMEADTGRLDVQTIGEGDAIVFHDGMSFEATWKKEDEGARTRFFDSSGAEIEMNAGATWVEIVPPGREITY